MSSHDENDVNAVRKKLNEDKIKLWLSPYTEVGRDAGFYPDEMITRFSSSLALAESTVLSILDQLRLHALQKLSSRTQTPTTPPGCVNPGGGTVITVHLKLLGRNRMTDLQIDYSYCTTGEILRSLVESKLNDTQFSELKLIHKGVLINDNSLIALTGLKNGSTILVLATDTTKLERDKERLSLLEQTRKDAELLSNDSSNVHCLEVANQDGKVIQMPVEERKALGVALAMHEKGRSALKRRTYDDALIFFLEADVQFKKCTMELLKQVDNYALLNLDIVWSYLCLGSISDLPDAEYRLSICEDCFNKSYGPNLERLNALKGGTGEEAALFARLHLLQAIVLYHKGNYKIAKIKFDNVRSELATLVVDDEKLAQVVSFGYTPAEARLALRSCYGNVESAVHQILRKREERTRIRKQEREERKKMAEQKKLGKCLDGEWLQGTLFNQLIAMGFSKDKAKQALKLSNNNIAMAVQILHDQGAALETINPEHVAQLVSMGFEQNAVEEALAISGGELTNAQEILVTKLELDPLIAATASASSSGLEDQSLKDAVERLTEDITEEEDDYLDLNMQEEENFLAEYMSLMQ